jgi:RNA recognition motif-containing protein
MIIQLKRFPPYASEKDIRNLFDTYGDVRGIIRMKKRAFVRMPDDDRADLAIQNLNGMKWKGWHINVKQINPDLTSPVCRTQLGIIRMF